MTESPIRHLATLTRRYLDAAIRDGETITVAIAPQLDPSEPPTLRVGDNMLTVEYSTFGAARDQLWRLYRADAGVPVGSAAAPFCGQAYSAVEAARLVVWRVADLMIEREEISA